MENRVVEEKTLLVAMKELIAMYAYALAVGMMGGLTGPVRAIRKSIKYDSHLHHHPVFAA